MEPAHPGALHAGDAALDQDGLEQATKAAARRNASVNVSKLLNIAALQYVRRFEFDT